jgi:hypothetical protein
MNRFEIALGKKPPDTPQLTEALEFCNGECRELKIGTCAKKYSLII